MLIQTSPHLHYRYTNVQLYNQKYVRLLGYIIDTDQTSKQENTTNLYICKVYTKYTLYIYRSKTKSRVGFFFLMLNNQILSFSVNRKNPTGSNPRARRADEAALGVASLTAHTALPEHLSETIFRSSRNPLSSTQALATLKCFSSYRYMYIYMYIFINSVKCQFGIM